MLSTIATKLAFYLTKWESSSEQIESCRYGLEVLLYTILSTSLLLLVGIICGLLINTIILIIVYYLNQTFGGGYHAHSHFSCFLTMVCGLLICFFIQVSFSSCSSIFYCLTIVSFIFLYKKPIHLHQNKEYLKRKSARIIKRSRFISSLSTIVAMLLIMVQNDYGVTVSLGIIAAAFSRCLGIKQEF